MLTRMPRRVSNPALWLLIAAALFMRAVVPSGWMPATEGTNVLSMRICDSSGNASTLTREIPMRAMPGHDGHGKGEQKNHQTSPCSFAGFASAAPIGGVALALALVLPPEQLRTAAIAAILVARLSWVTPPGRGPPSIV